MAKFQPKVPKGSISRYEQALEPKKYADSGRRPKLRQDRGKLAAYMGSDWSSLEERMESLMKQTLEWAMDLADPFGTDTGRYRKGGGSPADLGLPWGIHEYEIGRIFEIYGKKYRVTSIAQDGVQMELVNDAPAGPDEEALAALNLS